MYRSRRAELAKIAREYSSGAPIPYVTYTEQEIATWGAVYDRLGVSGVGIGCTMLRDVLRVCVNVFLRLCSPIFWHNVGIARTFCMLCLPYCFEKNAAFLRVSDFA